MTRDTWACLATVTLAVVGGSASAAPLFQVTNIGVPVGAHASAAFAINNRDQVTGYVAVGSQIHGFYYSAGVIQDMGVLPGGTFSVGSAINNAGTAVGYSTTSSQNRGFRFSGGTLLSIGVPPGGSGSQAGAINSRGDIAGIAGFPGSTFDRAYIKSGGAWTNLGLLPGDQYSSARGLNDLGQAVGESNDNSGGVVKKRAFLWSGGVMTDLGTPLGGWRYSGAGINNSGVAIGDYELASLDRGWVLDNGVMSDIPLLPGASTLLPRDINNAGQIVGGSGGRGFLYDDGVIVDLNTLLDSTGAGWTLGMATGINEYGHICGMGTFNGEARGYLLTPVPSPATLACLLPIAISSGRRRSSKR